MPAARPSPEHTPPRAQQTPPPTHSPTPTRQFQGSNPPPPPPAETSVHPSPSRPQGSYELLCALPNKSVSGTFPPARASRPKKLKTKKPPPSLKTSKKWVSSGGGLGGSGPKTHWGMRLLDKITILQRVKLTIQPLWVGYANRSKKAQNGGYVAFPPTYACLALI